MRENTGKKGRLLCLVNMTNDNLQIWENMGIKLKFVTFFQMNKLSTAITTNKFKEET